MAVRQYIGARYVIKIYENSVDPTSAEWEQVNFEPLTMVTYNYGSYLSKKEVPASVGNPAANPTYWVQTGFYNGQIASLQQQIDTINNTDLPNINLAIQGLGNRVTDTENDIDTLFGLVGQASSRKIIFIGDSISEVTDSNNKRFIDIAAENLGLTLDTNYFAEVHSGIGYTTNMTGVVKDFYECWEYFVSNHSSLDYNSITDVVVLGGINDITSTVDDIFNAMSLLVARIKTDCPYAKIYTGEPTKNSVNITGATLFRDVCMPAIRRCVELGAIFLDGLEYSLYNTKLQSDKLHPNSDGIAMLGKNLTDCLNNGICHTHSRCILTDDDVTLGAEVSAVTNIGVLSEGIDDEMITLSPDTANNLVITMAAPFSGYYFDLCTCNEFIRFGNRNWTRVPYTLPCTWTDESNVTHSDTLMLTRIHNRWKIDHHPSSGAVVSYTIPFPYYPDLPAYYG